MRRAQVFARSRRALWVAIRVLGYMCQYNFEVKTNATRAFSVVAHLDRFHTAEIR
jgi:hypothetical protein